MSRSLFTSPSTIEAAHARGIHPISIGDRFRGDHVSLGGVEWEVIGWTGRSTYSPAGLGGTATIVCKPLGDLDSTWQKYARADGYVEFCADSVAGILSRQEPNP